MEDYRTMIARRVGEVRLRIQERRTQAETFQAQAIGADVSTAEMKIRHSDRSTALADGMERALSMLGFGA